MGIRIPATSDLVCRLLLEKMQVIVVLVHCCGIAAWQRTVDRDSVIM